MQYLPRSHVLSVCVSINQPVRIESNRIESKTRSVIIY